jgi:H+/Cl- antiporter ClcA
VDPGSVLRSRQYRVLLVFAALIGVVVSFAAWGFLELVHGLQQWVFDDLPGELGFETVPSWWPLPVLGLAGAVVAVAVVRLPGRGGHEPSEGFKAGRPTRPIELPGILLAALATIALGFVLGPEGPLIALGAGLASLSVRLVKKDAPDQALGLMAAAGSFAAISTIFGSPVIGAVILIEAAGLGGATLSLILLPGLIAAGIGSLVFIGMGSATGLSTSAWSMSPLALPHVSQPDLNDFAWTIVISIALAALTFAVIEIGSQTKRLVKTQPYLLIPAAGLVVAGLAIAYAQSTDQSANTVLFSGQDALPSLINSGPTLAGSTLVLLFLCKGLAWGVSLGSARGGPTFPALLLGATAGLLASHLPGFAETQAVAVGMAAMVVAILRLPLSAVVIALLLTANAGAAVAPLIIVAVVVSFLTIEWLHDLRAPADGTAPASLRQMLAKRSRRDRDAAA